MKATQLSSGKDEPYWVDPNAIRFKISPHSDLSGIKGGDWDLERRYPLERATKYRAIFDRFLNGVPWEETQLFTDLYHRRFLAGDKVRDADSLEDLARQYYERVDGLHDDMKANGFRLKSDRGKPLPLPVLLIGRGDEVFIGNQGNHRLAVAQVVGLKRFAGKVICRHKSTL